MPISFPRLVGSGRNDNVGGPAIPFSEVEWGSEGSIVNFVETRWRNRNQNRADIERQWATNVAFYLGFQHSAYNKHTHTIYTPPVPKGRVRITANLLQPLAMKIVSKIMRQRPTWEVMAATNDHEDINSSMVGDKALRHYWRETSMDSKFKDAALWMAVTGNVFLRVFWDTKGGPRMEVKRAELDRFSESAREAFTKIAGKRARSATVPLGDIGYEVISPFQLDVDPDALAMDDIKWCIQSKVRSMSWIKEQFGEKAKKVTPGTGLGSQTTMHEDRLQNMGSPNTNHFYGRSTDAQRKDGAIVHEFWVAPSSENEKGRMIIVADGKVLNPKKGESDIPYDFHEIPIVHLQERDVPGRFWGTCAVEQCIRLQSEYNRLRSQIVEHQNETIKPQVYVPRGAQVSQQQLNGPPGSIIHYNPGLPPHEKPVNPLPQDILRRLEIIRQDINDVSAIQEVTKGRSTPNLRSGRAIQQLQEQDETNLDPVVADIEHQMGKLGSWTLNILAQFVEEERLIRVVGRNNLIESFSFLGKDLLGNETNIPGQNQFDVTVRMGSQLPTTRAGKLSLIGELTNIGYLNPEQHGEKVLNMVGMGPDDTLFDMPKLQRSAQLRELSALVRGARQPIQEYDDDALHIDVVNRFQLDPSYQDYPEVVKEVVEEHSALHRQRIQALQLQAQAAESGQPIAPLPEEFPPGALPDQGGEEIDIEDILARAAIAQQQGSQF